MIFCSSLRPYSENYDLRFPVMGPCNAVLAILAYGTCPSPRPHGLKASSGCVLPVQYAGDPLFHTMFPHTKMAVVTQKQMFFWSH